MSTTVFKFNFGEAGDDVAATFMANDDSRTCANVEIPTTEHLKATAKCISKFYINPTPAGSMLESIAAESKHWKDAREKSVTDGNFCRIAGVYEGGFDRWECSTDLLSYLKSERSQDLFQSNSDSDLDETLLRCRIIELGCGQALPGKYLLQQKLRIGRVRRDSSVRSHDGISDNKVAADSHACVDFQDYNADVLHALQVDFENSGLIANDECNSDLLLKQNISLYAGSWDDLTTVLPVHSYDCVLSAETCYDLRQIPALHAVIDHCLRLYEQNSDAVAYIAGKCEYAGENCGGGTVAFEAFVIQHGVFNVVARSSFGCGEESGLRREILVLKRRPQS